MDELIIRVISGQASPSEEEELRRWRQDSQENEAEFQRAVGVWSLTDPVHRSEVPEPPTGEAIAAAWRKEMEEEGDPSVVSIAHRRPPTQPLSKALRWTVGLAAGVAAVALGLQAVGWPAASPSPIAVFSADAGEFRTVTLDDGSQIRLAPQASLEAWEAEGERRFTLTGRAFFAVAHDPARPFVVEAGGVETRVLGTRFELRLTGEELRALVLDGRVALSNEEGRVEIPAGGVGYASRIEPPTAELPDDIYALLDWPDGVLLFHETPLARVAEEVARHYGLPVRISTERLRGFRISASFGQETFHEVVESLCQVVAAECTVTEEGATIADPS